MAPLHVSYAASDSTSCDEYTPPKSWATNVALEFTLNAPRPLRVAEPAAPGAVEEKASGGFFSSWVYFAQPRWFVRYSLLPFQWSWLLIAFIVVMVLQSIVPAAGAS